MLPKIFPQFVALILFVNNFLLAQPVSTPYHTESYQIYSGTYNGLGPGKQHIMSYQHVIRRNNAAWLRLIFGETTLSSDSYIRIISLRDGAEQKLNHSTLKLWQNTSAFFNGDEVRIELYVASVDSSVSFGVVKLMVGEYNSVTGITSICGTEDNRIRSTDSTVGRIVPVGCTGWIVSKGVMVTAGHCVGSDAQVVEFNVPSSLSDGTIQHPAPRDQYTINQGTWNYHDNGIGDDWAVFSVNNNSTTGKQPIQAQKAFLVPKQSLTPPTLRVTGNGVDGPAPNFGNRGAQNSDNQTEQTHAGPNAGSYGTILNYQVDTQPGNSGSPVIDESTGKAVGVHTNGGCTGSGGSNSGTSCYNSSFWNAITVNITLSSPQFMEGGSGASYKVDGTNVGTSFSGRGGLIEAIKPSGYEFIWWNDGLTTNPRTLPSDFSGYAVFKRIHFSNTTAAWNNTSQRKLIQTNINSNPRWLHQVYTSAGHVWLEHSSDGGSTWVIGNNGQPLDGIAGGKCPSIAFTSFSQIPGTTNYHIGVVWQEQFGSKYKIKGKIFNQLTGGSVPVPRWETTDIWVEPTDNYNSVNANPNLVMTEGILQEYLVAFEKKSTSGSLQPGINLLAGFTTDGGGWDVGSFGSPQFYQHVSGTNANTTNVQLSLYPGYNDILCDIIYQTHPTGAVYDVYILIYQGIGGDWRYYQDNAILLSYPYGDVNTSPSIVSLPDYWFAACWVEYDQLAFYRGISAVRSYFGSGVRATSINRGGGNSSNSGFVAWSQQTYSGSWSNKSMRFDNGFPVSSSIQTLSTTGRFVQVGNSATSNLSYMYVSSFYPFTSPYAFGTSGTLGPLSKVSPNIVEGRGFIINKGEASFYYRLDDLNVDGKNIAFVSSPDTADYSKIDILNNVLITEPFQLKSNSKIIFTERVGFVDSLSAIKSLGEKGFIDCRVELIDDATGKIVGTVKHVKLSSLNAFSFKKSSYTLTTKGFGDRIVKLRISLNTNYVDEPYSVLPHSSIPDEIRTKMGRPRISPPNLILTKSFAEENLTLAKSSFDELVLDAKDIPSSYALEQNYPNPFNPTTTINFSLPKAGSVTLKVYDVLGKEIATLINGEKQEGKYSVEFDGSNLSSGIYFVRMHTFDFSRTMKILLMK